jgi:hypothetical protein
VDSLIEAFAGLIIVWRFTGSRLTSSTSERLAQQLVAVSYFALVAYVAIESVRDLVGGHHPEASWVGIGLAAVTAPTMPLLASGEATGRTRTRLGGDGRRGRPEHDLRLPIDCAARRFARECRAWLVVGRPGGGSGDWCCRAA